MKCSNKKCNTELVEGAAFCHVCGKKQDGNDKTKDKRKNGDGSYSDWKDGLIRYRVVTSDGKRMAFYAKTQKECRQKRDEYEAELRNGKPADVNDSTLKDWAVQWLENYKKPNVVYGTYRNYADYTNNHIIPALGEMNLREIKPADIESFFANKKRRNLSESARRHIRIALRGIFETAIDNKLCEISPVKAQRRVGKKKQQPPPKAYTLEQVDKLKKVANEHPNSEYVMFPLYTGMRKGEILSLKWDDIDLKNMVISVDEGRVRAEEGGLKDEKPKSGKQRVVVIRKS